MHLRGIIGRQPLATWTCCLALLTAVLVLPLPARAMDAKAFSEFNKKMNATRRDDPAKAVADGKLFAQGNELTPGQITQLYYGIANIQNSTLKDVPGTLATLDEAIAKLGTNVERFRLIGQKATVLNAANRGAEVEALMQTHWADISKTTYYSQVLPVYVKALQKAGKNDDALKVTRTLLEARLEQEARKPDIFRTLIDQLLATGQREEAAGWGKLFFMVCPYEERSLQASLELLSRIWTAEQVSPAKAQELLDAQQAADKPSPLVTVKLPTHDSAALRARLATVKAPEERLVLQLALGDFADAMTTARGQMLAKPDSSAAILQVCRVFKARDLKLKRANAFLEFYKTGQGINPLTEFEQETTKAQKPAAG